MQGKELLEKHFTFCVFLKKLYEETCAIQTNDKAFNSSILTKLINFEDGPYQQHLSNDPACDPQFRTKRIHQYRNDIVRIHQNHIDEYFNFVIQDFFTSVSKRYPNNLSSLLGPALDNIALLPFIKVEDGCTMIAKARPIWDLNPGLVRNKPGL